MIYNIQNIEEVPYSQCQNAAIHPLACCEFAGIMEVGGVEYEVRITRDIDGMDGGPAWVWARVFLGRVPESAIDEYAKEAAALAKEHSSWEPVKVDLRYGLVTYAQLWLHHYPESAADMDEFLLRAKTFIETHGDYIDSVGCLEVWQ